MERARQLTFGAHSGRDHAWASLQELAASGKLPLQTATGDQWAWWFWIANLGHRTQEVIGPGIWSVSIDAEPGMPPRAFRLTLFRIDGSRRELCLYKAGRGLRVSMAE